MSNKKVKKNKRTLKKRIRHLIFLCFLISIIFFGSIIFAILSGAITSYSISSSFYKNKTTASYISSNSFLKELDIQSLESYDQNSPKAIEWYSKFDQYKSQMQDGEENVPSPLSMIGIKMDKDNTIFVKIVLNDKIIYSNFEDNSTVSNVKQISDIVTKTKTVSPIYNSSGNKIGEVTTQINPGFIGAIFLVSFGLIILLAILSLPAAGLISRIFTLPIINPLNRLQRSMETLANDKYLDNSNLHITLKRPLREIEELANCSNLIIDKMKGFYLKLETQNAELEAQNEELFESRQQIEEAQGKIVASEKAVRSLLDNAGQGFLTFDEDLLIDEEYSFECRRLFNFEIRDKKFSDIAFPEDAEQRKFLDSIFTKIFSEKETSKLSLYLPLLPNETVVNGRILDIKYKIIPDEEDRNADQFMIILTDITEKRNLQNLMEQERNILKMVVKVVVDYADFSECIKDYRDFCTFRLNTMLNSRNNLEDIIYEVFRNIHTFKGSFSQLDMINIVERLHQVESEISYISKNLTSVNLEDFKEFIFMLKMDKWLDNDICKLQEILGEDFFNQRSALMIDKLKLIEIEKKMVSILSPLECKLLLPDIQRLRQKPFKELLASYSEHIMRLSERLEKFINPLNIQGGDFLVDDEKYYSFVKSLIHVFRNIADHGIEEPDERIMLGKDEYGNIRCSARIYHDNIILSISDDGRGLDLGKIRKRAVEKGIYTAEEIANISDEKIMYLIFLENFSTKDDVSEFSGRGIGLSAVKHEVDKLNGYIKIKTFPTAGTEFEFTLPYNPISELPEISPLQIINPLRETASRFFKEQLGLELLSAEKFVLPQSDILALRNLTSFIDIKGILMGMFVLTLDEPLAAMLIKNFIADELSPEEEEEYMEDALAESSNIILGNSIKACPELEDFIEIQSPVTIKTEGASVKYSAADIWTCNFTTDVGTMTIAFVSSQE